MSEALLRVLIALLLATAATVAIRAAFKRAVSRVGIAVLGVAVVMSAVLALSGWWNPESSGDDQPSGQVTGTTLNVPDPDGPHVGPHGDEQRYGEHSPQP